MGEEFQLHTERHREEYFQSEGIKGSIKANKGQQHQLELGWAGQGLDVAKIKLNLFNDGTLLNTSGALTLPGGCLC